ncbi:MAG: T9SS type A sorting domain-containing protein [Saprospiraceae bacterium]|uniref:T9SS type A sorting domain-containing protein n=1 Tax=Candidatus Opimibacter skivensis TaxID=2982028 RepID=A0A9D7XR96_9BACT|nr:T9SS type A sorting domain-containing protein [Candidatus Opimibacter skivensis]
MLHKKWIIRTLFFSFSMSLSSQVSTQCLLSAMHVTQYNSGECNSVQFQQAIGQVFTAYGSCGGMNFTSPLTETDQMTGTSQGQNESFVRVYPNPVHDYLFIDAHEFQPGQIRIYSFIGSLIYQGKFNQDNLFTLDFSSYPSGGYLIKLIPQNQKCSTYTIIKS